MLLLSTDPRAPLYTSWPERREACANVVCEGPSACFASSEALLGALLPGPSVAVNRAIMFSDVIPFDAWATMDDPRNLWGLAKKHLHERTKLFSGDDSPNILIWRDILGDDIQKLYTRCPTYMDELADEDGAAPMAPTIFHALAWLLQVGVKRVRLIGCDMEGSGSPIGPDWRPENDEGFHLRWQVEREMLRLSQKHYRARGARIEQWQRS